MRHSNSFLSLGGRLSVNFANAPAIPAGPSPEQISWLDLIYFLEASKVVSAERASQLADLPRTDPQSSDALLSRAQRLRSALREVFSTLVRGEKISSGWVETINEVLRVTEGHDELLYEEGGWRLEFVARENGLDWLLAAVARSASEIIVEGHKAPVRKCSNPNCGLFFYDNSRTHRRRWCSMALCGNRHKVAAFAKRRGPLRARAAGA